MFVKITNGAVETFPYTIGQLRRDNPNTSFPSRVQDNTLASYGVHRVVVSEKPSVVAGQTVEAAAQPVLQDGSWVLHWVVRDMTADEVGVLSDEIRAKRQRLLSESDWMALSDTTMTPQWASYRQALRDITEQAGFPHVVTWPEKPSS